MLIQSKQTGEVHEATIDPVSTIEALGARWLVARAGDDCYRVNHFDATAYVIMGVSEEEERALAVDGYGMERGEVAA